jgi:hypothetical protein
LIVAMNPDPPDLRQNKHTRRLTWQCWRYQQVSSCWPLRLVLRQLARILLIKFR